MGFRWRKKPVLCNYYVTYRCNAKCSFCDIWEKPSPYVTQENLIHNLKDLYKLGVRIIDFTGGEPLLHQNLSAFCELAKKLNFQTTVTTNTLLYPKFAYSLKGKVDLLHFSIDSYNSDTHNKSRGVACYDFLLKSIDIALELGEHPDLLFTATNNNLHEIELIYQNICLPRGLILIINPIFRYNDIGDGLSQKSLNYLETWLGKKNIYLNKAFLKLRKNGGNDILNPVCRAASSTIVISPENNLLLPCYHLGIESFPIDNQLYQLWNSPKIQELIAFEGKYTKCKGCDINCYMSPSFAVEINSYFWNALPSTLQYLYEKKLKYYFRKQ